MIRTNLSLLPNLKKNSNNLHFKGNPMVEQERPTNIKIGDSWADRFTEDCKRYDRKETPFFNWIDPQEEIDLQNT